MGAAGAHGGGSNGALGGCPQVRGSWLSVSRESRGLCGAAVVMTACGDIHTLLVARDGALWVCVEGRDGQLGALGLDGETLWTGWGPPGFHRTAERCVFERMGADKRGGARVVFAAAGGSSQDEEGQEGHSTAWREDGALWTWGFIWNETGNTCFKAMPSMKRRSERRG